MLIYSVSVCVLVSLRSFRIPAVSCITWRLAWRLRAHLTWGGAGDSWRREGLQWPADCLNLSPCWHVVTVARRMDFVPRLMFLLLLSFVSARGMEPLALLATQGHWQAAEPIVVNVDYDGRSGLLCALAVWPHVLAMPRSTRVRHNR